ncbi:helix-turn-helix domain-containing protein [Streptomyces sp. NPDC086838]|uniref:helix-turn-helix domain-containing protein n=1 Tax=Streptomyces sp. NPDC086838 TaxID=3365762 RepID=UPI0038000F46
MVFEPASETAASVLRRLRETRGQSLRSTAEDLGLAPSHLSRLERGERSYTADVGERLAHYYGVDSESLDLALGVVPPDVVEILQNNPHEIERLRNKYKS